MIRRTFLQLGAAAFIGDWPINTKAVPAAMAIKLPRPLSPKQLERIVRTEVMRGYKWKLVGDASRTGGVNTYIPQVDYGYCGGCCRCETVPIK